jgi:hypothetical protein
MPTPQRRDPVSRVGEPEQAGYGYAFVELVPPDALAILDDLMVCIAAYSWRSFALRMPDSLDSNHLSD